MYKIIYMKADYEPWWEFEGWQEFVVSETEFEDRVKAEQYLKKLLQDFSLKYCKQQQKKDRFWAFWSENEAVYCDHCADELQIYHGLIWQEVE